MADVINKITMQVLKSVNTPDYENNPDWLIIKGNGVDIKLPSSDKKYWKISGDKVIEADVAEKKAIDDAEKVVKDKQEAETERERIIQETIHKMDEDKAIADGLIKAEK